MLSFIIPAHNEALEISRNLDSVFRAARAVGRPFEVIVVNDASTDRTGELARAAGARVVDVQLRRIAAVRNAGAREAAGNVLFFIDADTQLPEPTLQAALNVLDHGAAAGGAWVSFAEPVGLWTQLALSLFSFFYMIVFRWAAGCFIFARAEAFKASGGFDETLYACEEIVLSRALKQQGPFKVLHESVYTSARKLRFNSPWSIVPLALRFLRYGPAIFRQRKGLEWWYDGKRETKEAD